jgi:hypothetical protein
LLLILFSACTDINQPEINSEHETAVQNPGRKLLWRCDGMGIEASNEHIVWSELSCQIDPNRIYRLIVEYDGWTNTNVSDYISQVSINTDSCNIYLESGEEYINRHHELDFANISSSQIRFYIALWCDKTDCNGHVALKISNIRVYCY